jgi:hypothetical protein
MAEMVKTWGENAGAKQFKPQRSWEKMGFDRQTVGETWVFNPQLKFHQGVLKMDRIFVGFLWDLTIGSVRMQINHQQLGLASYPLVI